MNRFKLFSGLYGWPSEEYYWLTPNLIAEIFTCKTKNCTFSSDKKSNVTAHEATCTNESSILSKQIALGKPDRILSDLIEHGYLSEKMRNYRTTRFVTYDIETLEESKMDYVNSNAESHRLPEDNVEGATANI